MHKLWRSGSVRPYVTHYSSQFNVPYKATYVPIIYSVVIQLNSNKTKPFESYFSHSHIERTLLKWIYVEWVAIHYKFNPHQIYVTHTFPTDCIILYVAKLDFQSLSLYTTTMLYSRMHCRRLARLRVVRV